MKRLLWALFLGIFSLFIYLNLRSDLFFSRLNVLLYAKDLVYVLSVQPSGQSHLLSLPADTTINSLYGYGFYKLASLWDLGKLEKKPGLLAESLGENLGIPIPWYLEINLPPHKFFSFRGYWDYLRGSISSNLPFRLFFKFWSFRRSQGWDKLNLIEFKENFGLRKELQPDGSIINYFDQDHWDQILGSLLEDLVIRQEALSVVIYNTSGYPNLGQKVARVLNNLGMVVVFVGNEQPEIADCLLKTTNQQSRKKTVLAIARLYRCQIKLENDLDRANLELRLGTNNSRRFISH